MRNRSDLLEAFARSFHGVDDARALALLELSDDEWSEVSAGLGGLPGPVRAACQVVLDDWPRLDATSRTAALLVLANALAGALDDDSWIPSPPT